MHNKRNNHPNPNLPIIKILIDPPWIESKLRCQHHIANTHRHGQNPLNDRLPVQGSKTLEEGWAGKDVLLEG
jgi:hypothetical protein